ncbi:MAG: hypothetical protein RLZZ324_168, partial [Candidatus Parcubacteria bacterium]
MKNAYDLNGTDRAARGMSASLRTLSAYLKDERTHLAYAFAAIIVNSGLNLFAPYMVGRTIDLYVSRGDLGGIYTSALILLGTFSVAFVAQYLQIIMTGSIGQRLLFTLREAIFAKLQDLPIAFFDKNRAGDLISRINNDTDKLSQFFSETLVRFVSSTFIIVGSGIALVAMEPRLGVLAVLPAIVMVIATQLLGAWIKAKSLKSLRTLGGLSAEVQESLENFKVIVAFDRRDYFVKRFAEANEANYRSSVTAGLANASFVPLYELTSTVAQFSVVAYGISLITHGQMTIGMLVSFLLYADKFYGPFRQMAMLWSSFQLALAGWDRVSDILGLSSDLPVRPELAEPVRASAALLEFDDVHFGYPDGDEILRNVSFSLRRGKTYAFVGPTGGGKTTTASLMARLYDPTGGAVRLDGRDIRSFTQ